MNTHNQIDWLRWLPCPLWLVATIIWYIGFGRDTPARMLGRLSRHWFPMALIAVVYLMAAGYIGADLGIPMLFRDAPEIGFDPLYSRALWGAFGATVLVGEAWIIVYISEYIISYYRLAPARRREGWDSLKLWDNPSKSLDEFRDYRSVLKFLVASTPPLLLLLGLIAAFPRKIVGEPEFTRGRAFNVLIYGLGILLGALAVVAMVRVGWWLALRAGRIGLLRRGVELSTYLLRTKDLPEADSQVDKRLVTAVTASFWAFLAVIGLFALISMNLEHIVPSLAISVLFGLILALYFILISLRWILQLPFFISLILVISWSNSGAYKYQFPGMGTMNETSLYAEGNLRPANRSPAKEPSPEKPLLKNEDVLKAWRAHFGDERPKLVLVVVTGGAYRAGFWTAAVLDELDRRSRSEDKQLKGLTDHIRLITGASGGMVGAAYFAVLRGEPDKSDKSVVERMKQDTNLDSLTPVIQQMVQRDIPMIFCPISYQKVDRGIALEKEWKTLNCSFVSLYDAEKEGRCPSLIVSPMMIETGERMLISNLDLAFITQPRSNSGEPYLSSAREFFRLFPAAQPTFGLQTAIRMSATFPYVSPAVSLPTKPPRRLVDAGYYDNYGVNLAVAWAYQYHDWIQENTSGLALIQINAFPRTDPSREMVPGGAAIPESAGHSFDWLTSPIEGAIGARNWSMQYRNDEQLHYLDDVFNTPPKNPRFFEFFTFTCPIGIAMNWIITKNDITNIQMSINGTPVVINTTECTNNCQMYRLIKWWNGYPLPPQLRRAIPTHDYVPPYMLPEDFAVYVKRESGNDLVINHPLEGFEKRILKTVNLYTGDDGGYVAFYTQDRSKGVYSVGGGIYVVGQIRLQGHYVGRIFHPDGFGEDISASEELKKLCRETFGVEGWAGGDTGGWYGIPLETPAPNNFQPYMLPEDFAVYVKREGDRDIVVNHPVEGFEKRILKTVNLYNQCEDGGYVAFYTHDRSKGVYSVGGGIYVVGQIRLQGRYVGRIFHPDGFGEDISASEKLKKLCRETFGVEGWAGGDTGGWCGIP